METIEISKAELNSELFEDVLFFELSESGAMGFDEGAVSVVKSDGKLYRINFLKGDICFADIKEAFPTMETWNFGLCGNGGVASEGWRYFYIGLGCHLVIHEAVHEEFCAWRDRGESQAPKPVRWWRSFAEKFINKQN